MNSETTGCFEDGGYRVEVKVISQKGACQFGHQVDDVVVFDGETIQGRIYKSLVYFQLLSLARPQYHPISPQYPNIQKQSCSSQSITSPQTHITLIHRQPRFPDGTR
jgi:hypothetical protein